MNPQVNELTLNNLLSANGAAAFLGVALNTFTTYWWHGRKNASGEYYGGYLREKAIEDGGRRFFRISDVAECIVQRLDSAELYSRHKVVITPAALAYFEKTDKAIHQRLVKALDDKVAKPSPVRKAK